MVLTERAKKIIYSLIFILAVLAVSYLLYVVFFQTTPAPAPNANINNRNGQLPNINEPLGNVNNANRNVNGATGGIPAIGSVALGGLTSTTVLTPDVRTQDPAADRNGMMRYYNPDDGKFYRVDAAGNSTQIGTAQFAGASKVTWADTTNEVIIEFPDDANVYYDLNNNKQVTLPKEYRDFDFSPTSNQIAFKYMHIDPERRVLGVSSPDGSGARTLESLGTNEDRVTVQWSPTGTVAAQYAEFIDLNRQRLGFIGTRGENFKDTIVEGRGLQTQYSKDGKQLLYSVYSQATDYKPSLWIVDADGNSIGNNRSELQLNTFADKCAFHNTTTVYCAVPSNPKYGFGLEPDILQDVPDDIYKIDLSTGAKTKVAIPVDASGTAAYTIDSITVSNDGSFLYFRDDDTGQLVKILLQ